jgi:hypothetical protein
MAAYAGQPVLVSLRTLTDRSSQTWDATRRGKKFVFKSAAAACGSCLQAERRPLAKLSAKKFFTAPRRQTAATQLSCRRPVLLARRDEENRLVRLQLDSARGRGCKAAG